MTNSIVQGQRTWGLICSRVSFLIHFVFKGYYQKVLSQSSGRPSQPSPCFSWLSVVGWLDLSLWRNKALNLRGSCPGKAMSWSLNKEGHEESGKSRNSGGRQTWGKSQLEHSSSMWLWISCLTFWTLSFFMSQNGEHKICLSECFGGLMWKHQLCCIIQT